MADKAAEEKKKRERQLATPQRRLRSGLRPFNRPADNSERPEFPLKFGLLATLWGLPRVGRIEFGRQPVIVLLEDLINTYMKNILNKQYA
jgi:hypothetical protein